MKKTITVEGKTIELTPEPKGPFKREGVEFELTGEFAKYDPEKHEAYVNFANDKFVDVIAPNKGLNHGYRWILRRKEQQEWPKWTKDGWYVYEYRSADSFRGIGPTTGYELEAWTNCDEPCFGEDGETEITEAEAKKLIAEMQDKQWPKYYKSGEWFAKYQEDGTGEVIRPNGDIVVGLFWTQAELMAHPSTAEEYEKREAEVQREKEAKRYKYTKNCGGLMYVQDLQDSNRVVCVVFDAHEGQCIAAALNGKEGERE